MDFERVEGLLTLVREPEPLDEGFTELVMTKVQPSRLRSLKRFITRPMILAAATLTIGTAAVAAIQQDALRPSTPQEEKASVAADSQPQPSQGPSKIEPQNERRKDPSTAPSKRTEPSESSRPGGYTSTHTAYFSNGRLRLETETYTNEVRAGAPHDIALTLENLTDKRIAVYGPKGCMVQANVYSENSGNKTNLTFCPGSRRPTKPSSEMEVVVLEPHAKLVSQITILLPEKGGWFVTGLCPCGERQSPADDIEPVPLLRVTPTLSPTLRGNLVSAEIGEQIATYRYARLVTPQIRMEAK